MSRQNRSQVVKRKVRELLETNRQENVLEMLPSAKRSACKFNDWGKMGDKQCENVMEANYSLFNNSSLTDNEDKSNSNNKGSNESFRNKLAYWSINCNITSRSLNQLLVILKDKDSSLPSDARTLRETPRRSNIQVLCNGNLCYYGLENCLTDFLFKNSNLKSTKLDLQFGTDGLPLHPRSKKCEVWPILVNIIGYPDVYIICCFMGEKKPANSNVFLEKFVNEVKQIIAEGFSYNGNFYTITFHSFICDIPAKPFVLNIKGHSGFFCCNKCTTKGEKINNCLVLLDTEALLRTDETFNMRKQPEHHKSLDPIAIESLNVGCVSQFPLDYMHLVCLGIMKQLLHLWVKPKKGTSTLNKSQIELLNYRLLIASSQIPYEFNRKLRCLEELDFWKATEYRTFLLYVGPLALNGLLKEDMYNHFLKLVCSIRILLHPDDCIRNNDCARKLLKSFVDNFPKFYPKSSVTYNCHNLAHLWMDAKKYGSLENISAFKFETKLQEIKRMVHQGKYHLSQIYNRIIERSTFEQPQQQHFPIVKWNRKRSLVLKVYTEKFCFSWIYPNNFCLSGGCIKQIIHITEREGKIYITVRNVNNLRPYFTFPIQSSNLNIYFAPSLNYSKEEEQIELSPFITKVIRISLTSDNNLFLPLLHQS